MTVIQTPYYGTLYVTFIRSIEGFNRRHKVFEPSVKSYTTNLGSSGIRHHLDAFCFSKMGQMGKPPIGRIHQARSQLDPSTNRCVEQLQRDRDTLITMSYTDTSSGTLTLPLGLVRTQWSMGLSDNFNSKPGTVKIKVFLGRLMNGIKCRLSS